MRIFAFLTRKKQARKRLTEAIASADSEYALLQTVFEQFNRIPIVDWQSEVAAEIQQLLQAFALLRETTHSPSSLEEYNNLATEYELWTTRLDQTRSKAFDEMQARVLHIEETLVRASVLSEQLKACGEPDQELHQRIVAHSGVVEDALRHPKGEPLPPGMIDDLDTAYHIFLEIVETLTRTVDIIRRSHVRGRTLTLERHNRFCKSVEALTAKFARLRVLTTGSWEVCDTNFERLRILDEDLSELFLALDHITPDRWHEAISLLVVISEKLNIGFSLNRELRKAFDAFDKKVERFKHEVAEISVEINRLTQQVGGQDQVAYWLKKVWFVTQHLNAYVRNAMQVWEPIDNLLAVTEMLNDMLKLLRRASFQPSAWQRAAAKALPERIVFTGIAFLFK